jgi:hypothetical protein
MAVTPRRKKTRKRQKRRLIHILPGQVDCSGDSVFSILHGDGRYFNFCVDSDIPHTVLESEFSRRTECIDVHLTIGLEYITILYNLMGIDSSW